MSAAVIVSLRVATSPRHAFEAFTDEIGSWWTPGQLLQLTPSGDGQLRFEPGVGGRLVTRLPDGAEFEIGVITAWEPGARLALSWRQATFAPGQRTEVDVRFEAVGDGTRITLEHRGWEAIPQDHAARHGFALMPFQQRLVEYWRARLTALTRCGTRA